MCHPNCTQSCALNFYMKNGVPIRAEEALESHGLHDRSEDVRRTARVALASARGTDPEEYAGEFVAEVFEDAERSTDWPGVVDAFVPSDRREEWATLDATGQVCQVLDRADAYDRDAVDALEGIAADADRSTARTAFDEAIRCRHNADGFRNAVADAYARGRIDDGGLVAAVERTGFETDTIARREELLELIAEKHGFEFRPYGGTLLDGDRFQTDSSDSATW